MSSKKFDTFSLKHLATLTSLLLLSACGTVSSIPEHEYAEFSAKDKHDQIMNQVKVRWEIKENVADFCKKILTDASQDDDLGQSYIAPPVACSVWHTRNKECVIYTARKTTHVALGHELRHCFEGYFH